MIAESGGPGRRARAPGIDPGAARGPARQPRPGRAPRRSSAPSVVGKEFWHRAVADLSSPSDRAAVAGCAARARTQGPRDSRSAPRSPGEDAYRFRHALIRDVDVRRHAEGGARRPARGVRALAQAQPAAEASASTTRSSATTLEQALPLPRRARLRPTTHSGARSSRRRSCSARRAGGRSAREDMPAAVAMFERAADARSPGTTASSTRCATMRSSSGSAAMRAGEWDARARALARRGESLDAATTADRSCVRRRAPVAASHTELDGSGREARRRRRGARHRPSSSEIDDDLGLAQGVVAAERGAPSSRGVLGGAGGRRARTGARTTRDGRRRRGQVARSRRALHPGPATTGRRRSPKRFATMLRAARGDAGARRPSRRGLATTLAGLRAMEGRFDEARELVRRLVADLQEFGLRFRRAVRSIVGAPDRDARRRPRSPRSASCARATRCSRRWASADARSTLAGCSPRRSLAQGDDDEAERIRADRPTRPRPSDRAMPQVHWRHASARTSRRRSAITAPRRSTLAEAAVALAARPTSSTFGRHDRRPRRGVARWTGGADDASDEPGRGARALRAEGELGGVAALARTSSA